MPPAESPERRPFCRLVEREDGGQFDVLVATYAKGDATLALHGSLHFADPEHYAELQRRFHAFDALLYELIADADLRPYPGMATEDDWFNLLQGGVGRGIGLVSQSDHIDYRMDNFVHADMTHEQWQAALVQAKSSLLGQLLDNGEPGEPDREAEAKQRRLDLVAAFRGGRGVHELRLMFSRLMAEPDGQRREPNVIIEGRNERCLQVLQEQLAAGKKKLGIYYGAGHMEHMERRLLRDLGWTRTGEQWLMAWDNRASRFPVAKKGEQQRRFRARADVEGLTEALRTWLQAHPGATPTLAAMRQDAPGGKLPGRADGVDPWGKPYAILPQDRGFAVRSGGADGVLGNDDDIVGERVGSRRRG